MRHVRLLLWFIGAAGMLALASAAPITSNDPEQNRKLLRELRANDSENYARLVRNFEAFHALSPAQQEKLRQLDRQLHEEDSQTQMRMMRVLGEYSAWLTRLPEDERKRILAAPNSEERLRVIREVKAREWYNLAPQAVRDEWQAAPEAKKKDVLDRWRKDEQRQRDAWTEARKNWDDVIADAPTLPATAGDFGKELLTFLETRLKPMLNDEEKARLAFATGEWTRGNAWLLPRTALELSDRHPVLGLEPKYTTLAALPDDYKRALASLPKDARPAVGRLPIGRWPDYPVAVTKLLREHNAAPKAPLGPATAREFSPAVDDFVKKKLEPSLRESEKARLRKAEGQWPDYPLVLHDLAKEHKLAVPDIGLPGPPLMWDRIRGNRRPMLGPMLPEPPDYLLREFALKLNMQDPDGRRLSLSNPADREIIKKKFFEKYPEMLERLRTQDKMKFDRKGKMKPP